MVFLKPTLQLVFSSIINSTTFKSDRGVGTITRSMNAVRGVFNSYTNSTQLFFVLYSHVIPTGLTGLATNSNDGMPKLYQRQITLKIHHQCGRCSIT